jgi:hypothetical protein
MDENLNPDIILDPPVVYEQAPLPTPTVYANVAPDEVEKYRELVVHYFDNQMNKDILRLEGEDKNRMFQMLTDYADILEKIFHDGIPILEYIQDKSWAAAHKNPHTGINWEYSCPIIAEYKVWKESRVQNIEAPIQES